MPECGSRKGEEPGYSRSTIDKELAALRRAFNLAVKRSQYPAAAVPEISALKEQNVRTHFVDNKETKRLAEAHPTSCDLWPMRGI